jgi:hypothetical protein
MAGVEAIGKQYEDAKKGLERRFVDRSTSCSAATSCRPA